MSHLAYNNTIVAGSQPTLLPNWTVMHVSSPSTGFTAIAFQKSNVVVIALKCADPFIGTKLNMQNALNNTLEQYNSSKQFVQDVQARAAALGIINATYSLTGVVCSHHYHSLLSNVVNHSLDQSISKAFKMASAHSVHDDRRLIPALNSSSTVT